GRTSTGGRVLEFQTTQVVKQLLALTERKRIVLQRRRVDDLYGAVDDKEVQCAVVVEIEPRGAEARVWQADRAQARSSALVLEYAGTVIDVQVETLAGEIGHNEIFIPVIVDVAGVDTHSRFGFAARIERHPCQKRCVLERAIVQVDPELIGVAVIRYVEVDPTITIEVGRGYAKGRPELRRHSSSTRHISECPVAVVVVQLAR